MVSKWILSSPPCKKMNVRFTTVPFNIFSEKADTRVYCMAEQLEYAMYSGTPCTYTQCILGYHVHTFYSGTPYTYIVFWDTLYTIYSGTHVHTFYSGTPFTHNVFWDTLYTQCILGHNLHTFYFGTPCILTLGYQVHTM